MNKQGQRTAKGPDSAFWRHNMVMFWTIMIIWGGLTATMAVWLEFVRGIGAWGAIAGGFFLAWLIPIIVLLPRTSTSWRDYE